MSDKEKGKTFGERLMGMEGFTPARAEKYRAEMDALLAQRLQKHQRWSMGAGGLFMGVTLIVGGAAMATARNHPEAAQIDEFRWIVSVSCVLSGILLGGWLLGIAIKGQYDRPLEELMGMVIVSVFAGGWGAGLLNLAFATADEVLRIKLLLVGVGFLLVLPATCLMLGVSRRMHRKTQERLLRIEYRLAELMEHQKI